MAQWLRAGENKSRSTFTHCVTGACALTSLRLQFPCLKVGMNETVLTSKATPRINVLMHPAQGLAQSKTSVDADHNDDYM